MNSHKTTEELVANYFSSPYTRFLRKTADGSFNGFLDFLEHGHSYLDQMYYELIFKLDLRGLYNRTSEYAQRNFCIE